MKREKLLTGTATLAAAAALSGLFFVCKSNDYMEGKGGMVSAAEERVGAGITAEETGVQSAFRMKEGASIRLNKENDTYGIRFGAVVTDETKSYTMMIVPTELAGGYKESSGITLSEYCEKRAEEAGGRVAKAENLAPDGNGEITCALVRVKWENLNRAFTAIAYYEADGQRIEAARAEENARSVFEVAQKALDSGTLDEAERAAVEQLKADGEKEADGVAVDIGLTERLFEVEKQDEQDHVENEGNDWKFYGKQQLRVKMNAEVWKSRLRYKSGTAEFSLKAANGKGRAKLIDASGEAVLSVGLDYDVEKKVQLSTELLKTCTEIVFERTTETGAESAGADTVDGTGDTGSDSAAQAIYKMSEIREKTAAEAAQEMSERIAALSKIQSEIRVVGGEGGENEEDSGGYGQYLTDLDWAKQAYELGLSAEAKKLVSNSAELEKLWNTAFAAEKMLVSPATDQDFVSKGERPMFGANMQVEAKKDKTFEKVWVATRIPHERDDEQFTSGGYGYRSELMYAKTLEESEKAALIDGYAYVKFSVYVKHALAENETHTLYFTLPGEKYDKNNAKQVRKEVSLINGGWKEITLTSEEFKKFGRMTFCFAVLAPNDVGYDSRDELKISPFYGFN